MQAPAALRYRPDIDGLRALAVLAVVAFHAFPETVRGGFIGVDVFFVISGYLITALLQRELAAGQYSLIDFYVRRISRIFPALLTVMFACFLFGWVALLGAEYAQLGKHMAAGAGFVSNLILWRESGYFDNVAMTKPLQHLWSLAIEEQFYILWPLLLGLLWRMRASGVWVVVALAAASFAANLALMHTQIADFYAPYTRAWELLLGALLAYSAPAAKPAHAVSLIGLGMIGIGLCITTPAMFYPGVLAALPVIGAALVIGGGEGAWVNRALAWRPLVAIGRISYPLYLWHWPLLVYAYILYSEPVPTPVRWGLVGAAFLLAGLTYRFIEQPLRHRGAARRTATWLLAAMLLMGALGLHVYGTDGYRFRSAGQYFDNSHELQRTPKLDAACLQYLGVSEPATTYCRYTDAGGGRTVALIGDSQSHVAYPGIAALLQQQGVSTLLVGTEGCPPFLTSSAGKRDCAQQMRDSLAVVLPRKDIDRVLIFSRGAAYMNPDEVSGASARFTPAQMRAMLQATIDALRASGKQVFYVLENPQTRIWPAACIPRPLRHITRVCDIARADVEAEWVQYRQLAKSLRGVTLIDQTDTLCDAQSCHVVIDGALMYADDAHLSVAGSHYQAQHLFSKYLAK